MRNRWQTIRRASLGRHLHTEAYAALVLAGTYEEAGDLGHYEVHAGDVVFHDEFEGHLNRFPRGGATVLNLRIPTGNVCVPGIARVTDPDEVVRLVERGHREAVQLLLSSATSLPRQHGDWTDQLADTLREDPCLRLSGWAETMGLATWTVSREFTRVFGLSPEAFRAHARTRLALKAIRGTQRPLAAIAADLGFADQPHMTRSVKQLTSLPPRAWRSLIDRTRPQSRKWIQDGLAHGPLRCVHASFPSARPPSRTRGRPRSQDCLRAGIRARRH